MKTLRIVACAGLLIVAQNQILSSESPADQSLFSLRVAESKLVREASAFIEKNRDAAIAEWIALTEIPAPSGKEAKRAAVLRDKFAAAGFRPENTYYFLATVGEETGFQGMREFLKSPPEPIEEEADIEGLFTAQKQLVLLLASLR